jgi:hypothetical protein
MLTKYLTGALIKPNFTSYIYSANSYKNNVLYSQFRGIKDESKGATDNKLHEQLKSKKLEIQDFIDNKKLEIQDKFDDKKDELQSSLLNSKNDIKEFIADTKVELRDKVQEKSVEITKQKKKAESRVILNLADRSIAYLKNYSQILKDAFPNQVVKTYRIFSTGTKQLTQDMRTYYRVKDTLVHTIDKNKAHATLTRSDYDVYMNLPKDAMRVTPTLLISAFPFAQNVVFPLALLYPKLFLSSHFLTVKQKEEIIISHANSQQQICPLLQEELIRCTDMTYEKNADLMSLRKVLQSKQTLTEEEILLLRPLFEIGGPLDIRHLTRRHDKLLASFHRVWYLMFPYKHLEKYANILWRMDQALLREDLKSPVEGLDSLSVQRGLNPKHYSEDEQLAYIQSWLQISSQLKYKDLSLLLHLPIFLANRKQPFFHQ